MIKVVDKHNCCGCTACASVCRHRAITMTADDMGFLYPVVNTNLCVDCGLCNNVCQFYKGYQRYDNFVEPRVYGCRHKDKKELDKSQSGAASWSIIQSFLEEPGAVYGVGYKSVSHIAHKKATTIDECFEFRGSKYVQSDIRGIFEQIKTELSKGERVLFFGTACQVAGLSSFIPNCIKDNLLTVDIVCHSTPSPKVWESYIEYLERKKNSRIIKVDFRNKKYGWHSHNQSFNFSDNTSITNTIFFSMYYEHMIIRPSCSTCHYTNLNRVSDITIGDFWGWEKYYTEWNDNKGVSLMLVNSEKGLQMKKKAERYLDYIESDIEKCIQPQLQHPVSAHPDSKEIEELFAKKGFEGVARRYGYIPGLRYYKERFMPYFNAGKNKILKIFGISK